MKVIIICVGGTLIGAVLMEGMEPLDNSHCDSLDANFMPVDCIFELKKFDVEPVDNKRDGSN